MTDLQLNEGTISLADSRVLIVDDNRGSRMLLGALVAQVGVGNIEYAVDGEDGLDKVASFLPDLVLLDVRMPKMNGFEMCRKLRQDRAQTDLPVLIQTALSDDDSRADSFHAGATDMVSKPVVPVELMARVRIHLEKRLLIRNLSAYQERVAQELQSARAMQLGLLPKEAWVLDVASRHGLVISSHFEASSEIGGDIWDMVEIDEKRLGLYICDFSGHGVTAALNTFRLHTLARQTPPGGGDPGAWLSSINEKLKGLLPPGQFATLLYAIIDTKNDTFTYASAGAPSPILGLGREAGVVASEGIFLGVTAQATYTTRTVALPPGGFVFLYSDALPESLGSDGTYLGEDGLLNLVRKNLEAPSGEPLQEVLETFFAAVPRPLPDDLTAVWIARKRG